MTPEAFLRLDASSCDAVLNPADATRGSTLLEIVTLVGVRLARSTMWSARSALLESGDGVQQFLKELTIVDVCLAQPESEREALRVDHKMTLASGPTLIRWIGADHIAPFFAATVELSMATRLQSISPAHASSCRSTAWSRRQAPRRVHVLNRRQTGRSAPAAYFEWQQLPRECRSQNEENPGQHTPIRDPRSPALLVRPAFFRQQRFHQQPQVVAHERFHTSLTHVGRTLPLSSVDVSSLAAPFFQLSLRS
jgi:hypothetical protein